MAMAMGFIPNLDSSCSYFYRLSDSSGHFLARKKLERLERRLSEKSGYWRFFSFLFSRTGHEPLAVLA
jgi:hypothetical protein